MQSLNYQLSILIVVLRSLKSGILNSPPSKLLLDGLETRSNEFLKTGLVLRGKLLAIYPSRSSSAWESSPSCTYSKFNKIAVNEFP